MTNGLVVQISAFGPTHETGKRLDHADNRVRHAIECQRAPDHVRVAAEPRFPKAFRDHRDISAFLFLWQKRPAANRAQTEDIKVIRGCLEHRNLKRITQSRHRRGQSILRGESVEDGLAIAEMDVARRGEREVDRLFFEMREDVKNARRFSKRQPAQEKIVDQTEDRRVQSDPEREGNYCQEGEPRRFAQLPQRETKVGHHMNLDVELGTFGFRNLQSHEDFVQHQYAAATQFCLTTGAMMPQRGQDRLARLCLSPITQRTQLSGPPARIVRWDLYRRS